MLRKDDPEMAIEKEELISKIREALKPELTQISYETWILPLGIRSIDGNNIVFTAVSEYQQDFIENKYRTLIFNTLKYITNREWTFSVINLDEETKNDSKVISINEYKKDAEANSAEIESNKLTLNPKYTFETFVIGNNNRFAHAAALAVGNEPGNSYNPLFIYGGVGLGKTHLMHAIGNRILENNKYANVLYVTSEKFTNQLINAIKDNKNEAFRNKYRTIDVLLIDDIQFIAGKERIQEEFFHTFNTLYENRKQIIISSDKPPRDIPFLEDRLKSRFEWGLLADISCPDYETRLAILRKKAQDENIVIDDFILSDIANKIDSNIRELEGVFNKIVARASLTHSPITIELAENIINEFKYESEKVISCDFIKETVAKYFSISKDDLSGNKRSNDIAFPRQIAMFLCRDVANMSYPQIGIDFGGRDHSTVMHACRKIEKEIKEKSNTKLIVESVKNIIVDGKQ
jgi:chromosomal replication initiator protein